MPLVALVVDDSMLIRHTVCRFLEERGFAVESVSNGQEALDALATMKPDLIVTDMQMPRMGGPELINALKKNPKTAPIPIIIVAGHQSGLDHNESRANYTISKDIEIESQLKKALQTIFGSGAAQGKAE